MVLKGVERTLKHYMRVVIARFAQMPRHVFKCRHLSYRIYGATIVPNALKMEARQIRPMFARVSIVQWEGIRDVCVLQVSRIYTIGVSNFWTIGGVLMLTAEFREFAVEGASADLENARGGADVAVHRFDDLFDVLLFDDGQGAQF